MPALLDSIAYWTGQVLIAVVGVMVVMWIANRPLWYWSRKIRAKRKAHLEFMIREHEIIKLKFMNGRGLLDSKKGMDAWNNLCKIDQRNRDQLARIREQEKADKTG